MSNYLYLRKYQIQVSSESTKSSDGKTEKALDVSYLHCTFNVRRGMDFNNYAIVTIYNLNRETENQIINESDRLIINAGYEGYLNAVPYDPQTSNQAAGAGSKLNASSGSSDSSDVTQIQEGSPKQYGKIFDGSIIQTVRGKENNTDYTLTLVAMDGDLFANNNFIALSCVRGQNPRAVIETVTTKATTPTAIAKVSPGISGQTLPRGKVYFGRPRDYLQDVARSNNANAWIQDGEVHITKITDNYTDEALVLTPQTGLIGWPQQIQYGVSFRCLLNPQITVMSMIQLKNSEINGMQIQTNTPGQTQPQTLQLDPNQMYQAYEVEHIGDTRGNDWYTQVSGYSRYGKDVVPALIKYSGQNPNSV